MRFNSLLFFLSFSFGAVAQTPDDIMRAQDIIKNALKTYQPNFANEAPRSDYGNKFVFISSSMPRNALMSLLNQSHQTGIPLYMRGLINKNGKPDVIETQLYIGKLIQDAGLTNESVGILVDSNVFKIFNIDVVPAFVMTREPLLQCFDDNCALPIFNKLTGNISIGEAFKILETGY